ncbi:MAG: ribokinase [Erysipelotrichaceae bacterium]|nr:ribokinase [Erysipelotrichaceae bacterium]
MKKALVFGACNLDYVYQVQDFVQAKQTVSASRRQVFYGGKGLNQAIAMKRCGVEVCLGAAIGAEDGEGLLEELAKAAISMDLILRKPCPSGHAIIQTTPDGENCILLYGGANQTFTKKDVRLILSEFGSGDLLVLQNEINQMAEIMTQAHHKGMRIVLNPSPMNEQILQLPLSYVDAWIVNEEEARMLIKQKYESVNALDGKTLLAGMMKCFANKQIIVTLGKQGAFYGDETTTLYQAAYPVKAVDTTAAGDTFTGYCFGALIQGASIADAMRLGAQAAAIACTKQGALPSIPTRQEVEAWNF